MGQATNSSSRAIPEVGMTFTSMRDLIPNSTTGHKVIAAVNCFQPDGADVRYRWRCMLVYSSTDKNLYTRQPHCIYMM